MPKLLIVCRQEDGIYPSQDSNVELKHLDSFIWLAGMVSQVFYQDVALQQWKYRYYSLNEKTLAWYTDLGSNFQANQLTKTYCYIAIG